MNEQTEETCHCGANMEGCDHCWHCQCEQWETTLTSDAPRRSSATGRR